jgi:hypothetical protein
MSGFARLGSVERGVNPSAPPPAAPFVAVDTAQCFRCGEPLGVVRSPNFEPSRRPAELVWERQPGWTVRSGIWRITNWALERALQPGREARRNWGSGRERTLGYGPSATFNEDSRPTVYPLPLQVRCPQPRCGWVQSLDRDALVPLRGGCMPWQDRPSKKGLPTT